jgi:hypothetical protein
MVKAHTQLIEDKELWDSFVDQSKDGTLFHKWNSLRIMEKYSGCKLLSYGIYNGDELICIFPLFLKSKGLKSVFSPPPRTGIARLGFVMNREFNTLKQSKKEKYLDIVAEAFDKEIKKISPNYVSIGLVQNFLDVRSFERDGYDTKSNFTYTSDLNLSMDEIWNSFSRNLRNQIKSVDISKLKLLQSNDLSMFYEMEKNRYEKKGLNPPIENKNYIVEMFDAYPENLKLMCLCDNDNNIISAQINCEYKHSFVQWMGGARSHENSHYNEYLTWEFIKMAKNSGNIKMEWGGGTKAISQFKSKFNPTLGIYFTICKKDSISKFAEWTYLNFIRKIYRY